LVRASGYSKKEELSNRIEDLIFPLESLIKKHGEEPLPPVQVVYYQEDNDMIPMKDWMKALRAQSKHRARCIDKIGLLRDYGHELDRPHAAYLENDIYELRVRCEKLQYRMLYFFYERKRVVITHGIIKQTDKVPSEEIDRAVRMKNRYNQDPEFHTHWEVP
jgi:phage-related protein